MAESQLIDCKNCGGVVEAEVVARYVHPQDFLDERISFLKCKRCKSPVLISEEEALGEEEWDKPEVIYPLVDRKRMGPAVPSAIRLAFDEAVACNSVKAYTACVVMCRKVLEGICHESNAEGKSLVNQLADLQAKGIIDKRLAEWATMLRVTGNQAAHGLTENFDQHDANDVLEFTEAIAEYLFTYRDRFEAFEKRRKGNPKKPKKE